MPICTVKHKYYLRYLPTLGFEYYDDENNNTHDHITAPIEEKNKIK